MGPRFDRLRYEVFQNLFLSPMNTGSVRPAVATTPTARGIETHIGQHLCRRAIGVWLQQHLPLAVLKLKQQFGNTNNLFSCNNTYRSRY